VHVVIKVLVVDDDPLVRGGLKLMLGGAADVEVVGEASDGAEVVDAVTRSRPDVLTEREREVARAVAEGLSNVEIAERLHLSRSSIKATISSVLTRLDLTNRIQLAIIAHEADRT